MYSAQSASHSHLVALCTIRLLRCASMRGGGVLCYLYFSMFSLRYLVGSWLKYEKGFVLSAVNFRNRKESALLSGTVHLRYRAPWPTHYVVICRVLICFRSLVRSKILARLHFSVAMLNCCQQSSTLPPRRHPKSQSLSLLNP